MTWLHNSYLSHNLLRRDNLTADISFIYCFKRYYIIHTLHIPLMYIPLMYILSTFFFFPFFFPFPYKWNWDFYREKICKFAFASHACLCKVEGPLARSHVVILVNKVSQKSRVGDLWGKKMSVLVVLTVAKCSVWKNVVGALKLKQKHHEKETAVDR